MAGKIHRRKKSSEFVTLDTHCSRNKKLRWAPKGLHTYLFQLPDDWQINIADLENRSEDGRDSTTSAMNALIRAGYVVRERKHNDKGRFEGYDYFVFERPEHAVEWLTVNGKPVNGLTVNGKTATNKGLSYSKKNNNKNEGREDEKKQTPPPPETFDEMMERVNADVEAKKGKGINPVAPPPSFAPDCPACHGKGNNINGGYCWECSGTGEAPTHILKTTDTETLPGVLITDVHGISLEPTNPNATTSLFNRMNLTPQATNAIEAGAIIRKWCADEHETVKAAYDMVLRKFTPEDLSETIITFCASHANNTEIGKQRLFFTDPARVFLNGLTKWLQTQNKFDREQAAKAAQPKNGFPQPEQKSNLPKSIRRY